MQFEYSSDRKNKLLLWFCNHIKRYGGSGCCHFVIEFGMRSVYCIHTKIDEQGLGLRWSFIWILRLLCFFFENSVCLFCILVLVFARQSTYFRFWAKCLNLYTTHKQWVSGWMKNCSGSAGISLENPSKKTKKISSTDFQMLDLRFKFLFYLFFSSFPYFMRFYNSLRSLNPHFFFTNLLKYPINILVYFFTPRSVDSQ